MSHLHCSVTDCTHNCDRLCTLGSIKVEGQNADKAQLTFCHSFAPRNSHGGNRTENVRGLEGSASAETHIACDAMTCTYNKGNICSAKQVVVEGDCASTCTDTQCATFRLDNCHNR